MFRSEIERLLTFMDLHCHVFVCVHARTCTRGAKYSLLAHTTLRLPEAEGSFQSHSLIVLQDGEYRQQNVMCMDLKRIMLFISSLDSVQL